jgi:hypothetical protein
MCMTSRVLCGDDGCRAWSICLPVAAWKLHHTSSFLLLQRSVSIIRFFVRHNIPDSTTMLRNGATRFARSVTASAARPIASAQRMSPAHQWKTQFGSLAAKRPQTSQLARVTPIKATIPRRNITKEQQKAEDKYAHEKLVPTPETVSTTSTIHPIMSEHGAPTPEPDVDMMKGVRSDMVRCIPQNCLNVADFAGNYSRNLQPQRSSQRGLLYGPCRYNTLPRYIACHSPMRV